MTPAAIRALAARLGILDQYLDQTGRELRVTSDETRIAILEAMGFDASSDALAQRALSWLDEVDRSRPLSPVRVIEGGDLALPPNAEVVLESGASADPKTVLPLGYHAVHTPHAEQLLIIVPPSCVRPERPSVGVTANLYSVHGERDWGVGDFSSLAELARWSAERGASFVGVNPLHTLRNRGHDISPYRPVSRLYRNPIYIDVESVPELADSVEGRSLLAAPHVRRELAHLRGRERVEYERVWTLKRRVLEGLHRIFVARHRGPGTPRGRAFEAYRRREGLALSRFALFLALEDHFSLPGAHPVAWQEWPEAYRSPDAPEARAFAESHGREIEFHAWLQFEAERQLASAAAAGREAGLAMGLYQDLAIATAPDGSDVWAYPGLFLSGVSIGAPPDDYAAQGQNWGLPPLDPRRLAETRYAYFIALLRAALREVGALRIDHVLGLFRQFWIPAGRPGSEGAYVRFPTHQLFGILALESVRHNAVIVGEDLGTVPPEVPGILRKWGVLSSRVMFFEREWDGGFREASRYEPVALATVDTHDMVPLAGFWMGRDLELKRQVGLITDDAQLDAARASRAYERSRLLERLRADGALGPEPVDEVTLRAAVHRFLCQTASVLVGFSLDDLVGETEPVNVPGVGPDLFPSWTKRLRAPLEQCETRPDVAAAFPRCRSGQNDR